MIGTRSLRALELLDRVVDEGTFVSWDTPPDNSGADAEYRGQLARAAERSGADESVITGEGLIKGRRVAIAVSEFDFLAGSIGKATASRLIRAIERATREGIPMLAAPASGGTRMQEGTPAFIEMIKICAAIVRHKAAGLSYFVYLRNPTTGGVMASWGSLGHLTLAEPGALLGFLGPRVYEVLFDDTFPEGVQTAENLYKHGLVDGVAEPAELRDIVDRTLTIVGGPPPARVADPSDDFHGEVDAWESIERSRAAKRPGMRDFLRIAATDTVPLNGTGEGEVERGVMLALARFEDAPCIVIGHDRRNHADPHALGPVSLRVARRGIRLAGELGLPLLTLIDTPGAALSQQAEEGGLAREISLCLADLLTLEVPSLTVLLGQGCGGGAIALLPANRVVAAQGSWLSPLPPEGASAIVYRNADRAAEMSRQQRVSSVDLLKIGVVDRVVPEYPDAADEPEAFCSRLGAVVRYELAEMAGMSRAAVREGRLARFSD